MDKTYFVYMLSSRGGVLYVGVTGNLVRRVLQHRHHAVPGFTARYNVTRLVYFEATNSIKAAICREKQIKRWRREKKERLIRRMNPEWRDLAAHWYADGRRQDSRDGEGDPSTPRPCGPLRSG
ncbi:MAG: GIY-YIG nuclease family protein [Acidobacteria bacterium]|nr:GIY-YIG nuclease family protein [Acidobacteriota bacterium]